MTKKYIYLLALSGLAISLGAYGAEESYRVRTLANEGKVLFTSPDPQGIYCYDPGLAVCPNGRLIATFSLGEKMPKRLRRPEAKGTLSCTPPMIMERAGTTVRISRFTTSGHL